MAARPSRRAPDPMPATCPIGQGYVVALWSDRRPRVFALPTDHPHPLGRPHAIEVRLRQDRRVRWAACPTLRVTIGGRQVSRTLLSLLERHVVMRPPDLHPSWVLHSLDGSCSVGSLRWLARGDARRLRSGRAELAHVASRAVALRSAARTCCRTNDDAETA